MISAVRLAEIERTWRVDEALGHPSATDVLAVVAEVHRLQRIESAATVALVVTDSLPMVEMNADQMSGWRRAMTMVRAALGGDPS